MKKKTKIILCSILGAILLCGIGFTVVRVSENADLNITGTMVEGSGEYDWVKYDVYMEQYTRYQTKYYTHCSGDYIKNIYYTFDGSGHSISYDTYFNIADDFDTCFVLYSPLTNETLTTHVERTHSPVGGDSIYESDADADYCWCIKEIWIRTVD